MSNFSIDKLKAARQLIQMDARGDLDKISKKLQTEGKLGYDASEDGGINTAPIETQSYQKGDMAVNKEIIKTSKLPKEILESFKAKNSFEPSVSILENVDDSAFAEISKPNTVSESVRQAPTQNQPNDNGIDYSLIKTIVESTVKKYVGGIKKTLLSEGLNRNDTPNLQAMKIGEKFSFIDADGNLFEAKLKFIKNINRTEKKQ